MSLLPRHALTELIAARIDELVDLWVSGMSLKAAAEQLFLPPNTHILVYTSQELRAHIDAAREAKAAVAVDDAMDWASTAGTEGVKILDASLIRLGVDTNTKVAGKMDPKRWGDKTQLELSGGVAVEQNLNVSPAEAYERMIKGMP